MLSRISHVKYIKIYYGIYEDMLLNVSKYITRYMKICADLKDTLSSNEGLSLRWELW